MDCPKCNSQRHIKDRKINGRQRYLCKNYGRQYIVKKCSTKKSNETKRIALKLYLEGMGFSAIT